ncbi:L,D-transpeptidase family protein [Actinobacillus vicugnae]|uniref:L,D-transpeptidase family protein n=1 Tax=Actinobacillus vicugnae TaxID=2573093 RepID=UPI0012401788|nr:L,D-transpeptidase family protein [Actinobacillus vicugnae]
MNKVKTFKLLPVFMFSGIAVAETAQVTQPVAQSNVAVASQVTQDAILPQLSFAAQQARAAELAKRADYVFEQEQIRQEEARKLAEAETKLQQTVGANTLLLRKTTAKVYLDNNFANMWNDKAAEKQFIKEYALLATSGVSAKSAKALQQILNQPEGPARDMLLTDSFLDYLYYNKNVFKNANQWLYNLGSYTPKAPSAELINQWVNAVQNGTAGQFVANLVPRNHIYQETAQRVLSMSATGSARKAVKDKKAKGAAESETAATGNDTFYKLALNAQRLRIIPNFNNGIFVNIPSYQLFYFRDGQLTLQSKVIVGRDDRRTPVMYSKLSNVVVNPPWNIPPTILAKDVVPKLAKNPGFADAAGYEVFDGSGNKINPRSVNWAQYVNSKNIPYRIRQKAGDDSALGRFKFNMPSSDAIYLHDTPNRGLFGKNNRALSSGCVRVERSDELASILLKEAGWSMDRKQKVLASQKTTSANIQSDNPVYLYYVTAWVENGKVYTLPDIYKFDKAIPKNSVNWNKVRSVI